MRFNNKSRNDQAYETYVEVEITIGNRKPIYIYSLITR